VHNAKIIAPATSFKNAVQLFEAGADEVYFGVITKKCKEIFGEADLASRRQGTPANICDEKEMSDIADYALTHNKNATLVVNTNYTQVQMPYITALIDLWEDMGGQSIMVSDIGVLLYLLNKDSRLKRYLSLMANTFNSYGVGFYQSLGVSRIVFPRELSLSEIEIITKSTYDIEYEVLMMLQKCQFIDGYCGFYHGRHLPDHLPSYFEYHKIEGSPMPVTYSHDPAYEGPGCFVNWTTGKGKVTNLERNDLTAPHCGCCYLNKLYNAGVNNFKIAGRGYSQDFIVKTVRFIKETTTLWSSSEDETITKASIRKLYQYVYGEYCHEQRCYFE
jgi:collagenase-like PrtC family protease